MAILTAYKTEWYNFSMHGKIRLCIIFMLAVLLPGSMPVMAAHLPPELAGLRQSVLALDSAWSMALKDLQQKKEKGALQDTERKDYAKFITFLSGRIDDYCRQLEQAGGPAATENLPCPQQSDGEAVLEKPAAQTASEQVAALDQSLTQSLGSFDDQLLNEEKRIARRMPRQRESSQGSGSSSDSGHGTFSQSGGSGTEGGTSGASSTGTQAGGGNATAGNTSSRQDGNGQGQAPGEDHSGNSAGGQEGNTAAGGAGAGTDKPGGASGSGAMPSIESGYDDIVARQLREAAEKETDPELKEKLWEEYRKYKESVR